jgi:hypothetical protein
MQPWPMDLPHRETMAWEGDLDMSHMHYGDHGTDTTT